MVTENKTKRKKPKKSDILRHAEYYDMQKTFDDLFAKSKSGEKFYDLMDLILSRENILLAYRNIKGNNGSITPGTDNLTIRDLAKNTSEEMVQKVRNIIKNYNPRMVRRKDIPKEGNPEKIRPLGIPCIWDRLVQQCILQVLEPICEASFSENSYGFRPNRSCEHAIAQAYKHMQQTNLHYVVEVDIKGFFDNVNHSKLIKQIWAIGIQDKSLIYIIKRILKAPILMPDLTVVIPERGTPQGGILSPLLANIVLNEFDKWVESQWQNNPVIYKCKIRYNSNGTENKSDGYLAMKSTGLKEMYIVRYADDFRIFCRTKTAAENTLTAVKQWLNERLKLEVSMEKTKVVNLKRQYSEFLGIKMKVWRRNPDGAKYVVKSHVCDKAAKRIRMNAKEKVRAIANPKDNKNEFQSIMAYNAFVMGVQNYYQIATDVSLDFGKIGYPIVKSFTNMKNRNRLKRHPTEKVTNAITKRYESSAQLRWIHNIPVVPISYVRTKYPMCKKRSVQKYTPEGRAEIHDNLGINTHFMVALMRQPLYNRSVQLADNRISLYCAQRGQCAVTGKVFTNVGEMHCHHKSPRNKNGGDEYKNLVLVSENVHVLIHATTQETIAKILDLLNLSADQLKKVNKLRTLVGNESIVTK